MPKKTTRVIEVKEAPSMKRPSIMQGIRDKASAESWGVRNGYPVVYFIARKQKVYADRDATSEALATTCGSPEIER